MFNISGYFSDGKIFFAHFRTPVNVDNDQKATVIIITIPSHLTFK